MVRTIVAVVVGYIVVVILSIGSAVGSWALFGASGAFVEGSTVASTQWAISSCIFGFIAAIAAGATATAIGKHPTNLPVKVLACVMVVFGLLLAVMTVGVEPQPLPAGKAVADLTFLEAGQVASSPVWYLFAIPFVGAAGALVGGKLMGGPGDGS